MALLLADGQLAATASTILGIGTHERIVAITLYNAVASEQVVTLRVSRAGSTARKIAGATLKESEALYVVGLPLDSSDVLSAVASNAEAVDYLVTASSGQFAVFARTANGAPKMSEDIEEVTAAAAQESSSGADTDIPAWAAIQIGLLEQQRDLLLKIS